MGRRPGPAARRRAQPGTAPAQTLSADADQADLDSAAQSLDPTAQAEAPGVLSGCTFALSTTGESQSELAALIVAGGGAVVKIVNGGVDYLVATPLAVRRKTQAVRKAREKFGVPLVLPDFVRAALATGALGDPAAYEPRADAVDSGGRDGPPKIGASLESLGLQAGSRTRRVAAWTGGVAASHTGPL